MKTKRRKLTVTLHDEIVRWARIEAARAETSFSRFLGKIFEERMLAQVGYNAAMRRALAREPFPKPQARHLSHESTHDRNHLR